MRPKLTACTAAVCAAQVSHVRGGNHNNRRLKKERWMDGMLHVAQDRCMAEVLRLNRAVTRLAVMGFVKVTCSRSGAFARDWADRAEKQVRAPRPRARLLQRLAMGECVVCWGVRMHTHFIRRSCDRR